MPPPLTRPAVVLFDMDGTLTDPVLDFDLIRKDMGLPPGQPILEALAELPPSDRETALEVLHRHERDAADRSTLAPGVTDLLALLARQNIPTALITRNSRDCTARVLAKHALTFPALVTREDEPYKPHPAPLFLALDRLRSPARGHAVWMVGDGEFDITAAHAAGVRAIWLSHHQPRPFPATPCATIPTLPHFTTLLRSLLEEDGTADERR